MGLYDHFVFKIKLDQSNLILRTPEPSSSLWRTDDRMQERKKTTTGGAAGGWMKRMEAEYFFLFNSLLTSRSFSPTPYHSSPCFIHLSIWQVQTAAFFQLPFHASAVLLTLSLISSHSLLRSLALSSCPSSSFIYPSFYACFSTPVFLSLTCSCLIYVIPCISSTSCPIHPLPVSLVPTFFSLHVDLWWSPPLIPLLLISSAHGPVFCCRPNSGQNRT